MQSLSCLPPGISRTVLIVHATGRLVPMGQ